MTSEIIIATAGPSVVQYTRLIESAMQEIIAVNGAAMMFENVDAVCAVDHRMVREIEKHNLKRGQICDLITGADSANRVLNDAARCEIWAEVYNLEADRRDFKLDYSFNFALLYACERLGTGTIWILGHDCTDATDCAGLNGTRHQERWQKENAITQNILSRYPGITAVKGTSLC